LRIKDGAVYMDDALETEFPVHWISKEARYKIIDIMLSTRSITELARVLGISPTAVRKYVKRIAHPSDTVLARAIEQAEMYEKAAIIEVIINDLLEAVAKLYKSVDDKYKEEIRERLATILGAGIC